jgi:hypothetical protein
MSGQKPEMPEAPDSAPQPPGSAATSRQYLARSITGFVEMCGRHPFATGLFALMGIVGLAFSFFTFVVDQAQTKKDSAETAEIRSSVLRLEQAVIESTPPEETMGFDPLTSDTKPIEEQIDNITFNRSFANRSISWIFENVPESFSEYFIMEFSIRSQAEKDFVQVAPYLVIEVQNVEAIPDDIVTIDQSERGGAAAVREFQASVVPRRGFQFAPLIDSVTGDYRNDVDYFSLMPREPEEFVLNFSFVPGHIYTLRIGAPYKYKGRVGVHWMTQSFRAGVPDTELPVKTWESEYVLGPHPHFRAGEAERVRVDAGAHDRRVAESKVFPTDLLSGR